MINFEGHLLYLRYSQYETCFIYLKVEDPGSEISSIVIENMRGALNLSLAVGSSMDVMCVQSKQCGSSGRCQKNRTLGSNLGRLILAPSPTFLLSRLLYYHYPTLSVVASPRSRDRCSLICSYLLLLNSHHESGFCPGRLVRYKPLPTKTSIRLLQKDEEADGRIQCSLHVVDLKDSPCYCALSYTWGTLIWTTSSRQILCRTS